MDEPSVPIEQAGAVLERMHGYNTIGMEVIAEWERTRLAGGTLQWIGTGRRQRNS
jgi:hypothetical protein